MAIRKVRTRFTYKLFLTLRPIDTNLVLRDTQYASRYTQYELQASSIQDPAL